MNGLMTTDQQNTTALERYRHIDWENYRFESCDTVLDVVGPIYEVDVYAALMRADGNMKMAALLLHRPRDSLARWLKAHPDMQQVAIDLEEGDLDDIEQMARTQAKAGDTSQIRFLLSTKGRSRGYATRTETTGKMAHHFDFQKVAEARLSDEQILRMAREIVANDTEESNTIDGTYSEE